MATTQSVEVDTPSNEVRIEDLVVHDDDLVDYLDGLDEDRQEEAIVQALKVGAATLKLAETSKDLEYVKREFESMNDAFEREIEDVQDEIDETFGDDGDLPALLDEYLGEDGALRTHLERAFGEDGIFSDRLDEELGEDGERFREALDPDKEGTPTYRLKQTLRDELNDIETLLTDEEAKEAVRQRTTLKGDDFEDVVRDLLDDLVKQTPHSYTYTGETEGELSGRDVGDFVVTLGDTDQRLVVEAKSQKNLTVPTIKEEMEAAMENRLADFGIFLTECRNYLPDKVGYFQEYNQEYVVVAVSADEEDEIDQRLFKFAYNWAKMRAAQAAVDTGGDVDGELIQSRIEEVRASIDRFQQIKKKCTNIRKSANGIEEDLSDIEGDVNTFLHDIQAELSKAES